jgi:hypothetical protein
VKLCLTLFLSALLAGLASAQKQPAKAPFTLVLTIEKATVTLGSDVWVKVRWTNTSDQALDASANILDATNADPNFLFKFLDEEGRPVPRKVYRFPQTSGHAEFGSLDAGESITHDVNLIRLFELKKPGKYMLQVSRLIPKPPGSGIVKSNVLTITVIGG